MLALPVLALMLLITALVAGWLVLIWRIIRRPILSVPIAAYIGLAVWLGGHDAQALFIYALMLLGLWRLMHKPSFQRAVGWRLRSSWRRLWVYDRRWRTTMVRSGLGERYGLRDHVPRIRSFQSEPEVDRVLIGLVAGQCAQDVERAAPRLAQSFGARSCLVTEDRRGRVLLTFATGDTPTEPPQAPDPAPPQALSESGIPSVVP